MAINRRNFLVTSGLAAGGTALGFGLILQVGREENSVPGLFGPNEPLGVWVQLNSENEIRVFIPHVEMGQGVHTALAMMLAEELDADWSQLIVTQAPVSDSFSIANRFNLMDGEFERFTKSLLGTLGVDRFKVTESQLTANSSSVRLTGELVMRTAGALVREALLMCAAEKWGVSKFECITNNSFVIHESDNRRLSYGELALEVSAIPSLEDISFKSKNEYSLVGTSIPRLDIPEKVTGELGYGIDHWEEGLLYAAVKHTTVNGTGRLDTNRESIANMRGVEAVLEFDDAIVVVADNYWRAESALSQLGLEITSNENSVSSQTLQQRRSELLRSAAVRTLFTHGNVENTPVENPNLISAEYSVPFLAHAALEPVNCTVHVKDEQVFVAVGVQDPIHARNKIAETLQVNPGQVFVDAKMPGGGFGRRLPQDEGLLDLSARIAANFSVPVKTIFSREEDTGRDYFRPAVTSLLRAELTRDTEIGYWHNRFTGPISQPEAVQIPYAVENQSIEVVDNDVQISIGNWRSVDHSQHAFFTEAFIDEVALENDIDPLQFRLSNLAARPSYINVLQRAADIAGYNNAGNSDRSQGIAIHACYGSIVAQVFEVSVNENDVLQIHTVYCVIDCGRVINPDTVRAQVEGGILFGLSAALFEEILIDEGQVVNRNFDTYPVLKLSQTPDIVIDIVDSDRNPGGVGEAATPTVAPALVNAIFSASNKRIRKLPIVTQGISLAS